MDSTTDPGIGGFLNIFGESAENEPTPDTDAAPQDTAAVADAASPEGSSTDDLTAEEIVAARFAALEDGGAAEPVPDPEATPPVAAEADHPLLTTPAGDPSLDEMTPEQLRALAEEAIKLRGEASTNSRQEAGRKVAAAEAAAVAEVQTAYEQNVLAVAERHYDTIFDQRQAQIEAESERADDPARYRREQIAALRRRVDAAKQGWIAEQAELYEQEAATAVLRARHTSPEFRQYAAEELVKRAGLPVEVVPEVLKVRDVRDFQAEVDKLVGTRDALLAERNRNANQRREEGRQRLIADAPRTAAKGRLPGGKPPEYQGTIAEAVAILTR